MTAPAFHSIREAIADIRSGKMVILVDDEDRENEGDLYCAAEKITPEMVNFMATHGRGLICLTLEEAQVKQLGLPMMTTSNRSSFHTNFTISIEAAHGVSTGISAADRAHTIRCAINSQASPADLVSPGHVFPIKAREGGVLTRAGQTEGSVDISRLAGLHPSGVICEIMNDDGSMARYPQLKVFADKFDLKIVTVKDLISHRLKTESLIRRVEELELNTKAGRFSLIIFANTLGNELYFAFTKGCWEGSEVVPVRVQVQNMLTDLIDLEHSTQDIQGLGHALNFLQSLPKGILLYIVKEYNPAALLDQIRRYTSPPSPPPSAGGGSLREYGLGAQVLRELGVQQIQLITSDTDKKLVGLEGYGLEVSSSIAF